MSTVSLTESGITFQAVGMLILIVDVATPREGDLGLEWQSESHLLPDWRIRTVFIGQASKG